MHKMAMELGKRVMEEAKAKGLDSFNADDWEKLKYTMEIVKNAICADKDYRIVCAMDEAEEEEKIMGRMGYRGRDPRTGRFVHRSGRGRSAGYTPYPYLHMMEDGMEDYDMYDEIPYPMTGYRMGYSGGRGGSMGNPGSYSSGQSYSGNSGRDGENSGSGNRRYGYEEARQSSKYGDSYNRYKDSRRHYTENPTPEYQQKMKEDADDVFEDIEDLAKKMYSEADANDKAKFKQKMTQLVQNMK